MGYDIISDNFMQAHLVLLPHGIAPTFLKLDLCLPGAVFIPIIFTKRINQIKKVNCKKKKEFNRYKKIYYISKNMGEIPCGCNSTSII